MANNDVAIVKDGKVYIMQAGTPVYLKTADVCSMFGKSNQWIGQLTKQGTIFKKKTAQGSMYELNETVKSYIKTLEDKKTTDNEEKLELEKLKSENEIKKAKAVIAALEAKERVGKMHRASDVAAMTEDLVFAIRAALVALPGRLAVDVAGMTDLAEISEVIRVEIFHILDELSNYEYDPKKYEERVRERLRLEPLGGQEDDNE